MDAPVVKAVFLNDTYCKLDLNVTCKGEGSPISTIFFPVFLDLLLCFCYCHLGAILYINFIDAMNLHQCELVLTLYDDLISLDPLITVIGDDEANPDFGSLLKFPSGNPNIWQTSGRFFTIFNISGVASIEAILREQQNVTASITPCKSSFRRYYSPRQLLTSSPPQPLTPFIVIGNWILYGQTASFQAFQGIIAGVLVTLFHSISLFSPLTQTPTGCIFGVHPFFSGETILE